jgi:tetratricopeptide (TPR) repeat protein
MSSSMKQAGKARGKRTHGARGGRSRDSSGVPGPRPWLCLAIVVGVLSILIFLAYGNSLSNGFVWDDHEQIVMNPGLRPGTPWTALFSSDVWNPLHQDQPAKTNYYRPLQMVSYRTVSELFGPSAHVLHLLSVILALLTVLAAFWVCLELVPGSGIAFAAAALFAVHPVHSEAVDWISALPEIGCTACLLLAFGIFLALRRRQLESAAPPAFRFWILWCLSLFFFAAAFLWKETAIVLPLLVASYVLCIEPGSIGRRAWSAAKLSLPFWCVLGIYLVVRLRVLGFLAMRQRIWELTPVQAGLSALHLLALYWWKLAFPGPLNAYHVFSPVRSPGDIRAIAGWVFVVLSCLAIGYGLLRARLAAFAAIWVFITLLPVMDIYALGRNVFAERYLYLPSFGFCLLVTLLADSAIQRLPVRAQKPVAVLSLAAAVVALGWMTMARNPDWHDDAALFRKTLLQSPNAPFVHFMVASTVTADFVEAESHYQKAMELAEAESPPDLLDLTRSYEGLASLYADRGDYARALDILRHWRQVDPSESAIDVEEGLVLLRSGNWQQAQPLLAKANAARPQNENVLNALGLLAWEYQRNLDKAAALFSQALAIHTSEDDFQASLHNNLGGVFGDQRRFPLAVAQFESAVSISPGNPEYRTNLATAMAAAGRSSDAVQQVVQVLRADPTYAPARALLQQLQQLQEEKP